MPAAAGEILGGPKAPKKAPAAAEDAATDGTDSGPAAALPAAKRPRAMKAMKNYCLSNFTEGSSSVDAEKYLVHVLHPNTLCKCNTFDDLCYELYTDKKKSLPELPPSSNVIRGHILRAKYACTVY